MWLSTFEISAAQLRSVIEIALKSPFLCMKGSTILYGFRARTKALRHSMNTALISKTTHLHVLRKVLASAMISLITKTTHCIYWGLIIIKLISKTKHLHVPREIPACAMISLTTKTTHCTWGLIIRTINFQERFWGPVHRNPPDICVVEIALRKAARGIDSLNNVILFCSIQLKRSKGLKLFDLDESVSEAISSTVRYKLTPDGAVPIEVSKRDE